MEVGKEQATEITDYYQREVHVSVEEASFTSGQVGERKLMELRLVCFFFSSSCNIGGSNWSSVKCS